MKMEAGAVSLLAVAQSPIPSQTFNIEEEQKKKNQILVNQL